MQLGGTGSESILRTNATDSGSGAGGGPDLTAAVESNSMAFTFANGSDEVTISGPGLWSTSDEDEPYIGNIPTAELTAVNTWLGNLGTTDSVTLTIDDGQSTDHAVDPDDVDWSFETAEPSVTYGLNPARLSLFDATAVNPGDDGDIGLRWLEPFTAFATEPNATRAHLIANNRMAGGVTPATFEDQGDNERRIDWFVLHHGNDFVILNLDASVTAATVADYRVAFRDRETGTVWDYLLSADANDADPYEMPATQADLDAIVAVISGGGTLDAIIYDEDIADNLRGWNGANLTYDAPAMHQVDAGDVTWAFTVPEPSVTHVSVPSFADDTGDEIVAALGDTIADVVVPEAAGNPTPTYAVVGSLPAGVTFAAATRTLSFDGSAVEVGAGTITIRATNANGSADWTVAYAFVSLGLHVSVSADATDVTAGAEVALTAEAYGDLVAIEQAGAESENLFALTQVADGTWRLLRRGSISGANLRNPRGLTTKGGVLYAVDWWGEDIWTITDVDTGAATEIGSETASAFGAPEGAAFIGDVLWSIDQQGDDLWSWDDVDNSPNSGVQRGTVTIAGSPRGMTVRGGLLVIVTESGSNWDVLQVDNTTTGARTSLASTSGLPSGVTGLPIAIQEYRGSLWILTQDAELVEVSGIGGTPAFAERADFDPAGLRSGTNGLGGMTQFPMPSTYAWTSDNGGTFADATAKDTTWDSTGVTGATTLTLTVTEQDGSTTVAASVSVNVAAGAIDHAVDAGDVTWAFTLPEPSVTHNRQHFINAGDLTWTFIVPEPTVTHTPAAPRALTADAGDVTWQFETPEPSVSHVQGAGTDHAVNAGDLTWTFLTPQPTVTHVRGPATDHTADAGDVSWSFETPEPSITHTRGPATDHAVNAGDLTWTFLVPEPSVTRTRPHRVDAGDVDWQFTVPEPQITHLPSGGTAYRVDAGDVLWAFAVPEPAITHVRGPATDHAVDAGDVLWSFATPQPTVTHNRAAGNDLVADAGDVSWSFETPQPTVTHVRAAARNLTADAGDVTWRFDLPQPTVTHVASTTDHAVDPGDVEWSFATPQPSITHLQAHAVDAGDVSWSFETPQPRVTRTAALAAPSFADNTGEPIRAQVGAMVEDKPVPEADGNPVPTYAVVGSLPSGVAFDSAGRVLRFAPSLFTAGSGTIRIRATNSEGMADWTVAYEFTAVTAVPPSPPLFPRIEPAADGTGFDLVWNAPLDNGGGEITAYEAFVCDETGGNCGWERVWPTD